MLQIKKINPKFKLTCVFFFIRAMLSILNIVIGIWIILPLLLTSEILNSFYHSVINTKTNACMTLFVLFLCSVQNRIIPYRSNWTSLENTVLEWTRFYCPASPLMRFASEWHKKIIFHDSLSNSKQTSPFKLFRSPLWKLIC